MPKKLTAKAEAESLVKQNGIEKAKNLVSKAIEDLSVGGHAHTNIHQLRFWINVLFKIDLLDKEKVINQYKNGKCNGIWEHYHPNGNIECTGKYKDGIMVGIWKYFWDDGTLSATGRYNRYGEQSGIWREYSQTGEEYSIVF